MISDCSSSTFHLTHWVRDRTKGPRVPLETAVHKLTGAPAQMYGFTDRGFIREGMRADINVIDFERLTIEEPIIRADLPTGAKRILQPATGYLARLVNGVMVRRNDIDTGERPGHLLRSGQGSRGVTRIESVVVVGGGIGGLCTALWLGDRGYRVTVLERDDISVPDNVEEAWSSWDRSGAPQVAVPAHRDGAALQPAA